MIMNVGKIFPWVLGLIVQFDYCFFFQFYTTGMKIRKKVRKKENINKRKKNEKIERSWLILSLSEGMILDLKILIKLWRNALIK